MINNFEKLIKRVIKNDLDIHPLHLVIKDGARNFLKLSLKQNQKANF